MPVGLTITDPNRNLERRARNLSNAATRQGQVSSLAVDNTATTAVRTLEQQANTAFDRPTQYIAKGWIGLKARRRGDITQGLVVPRNTPGDPQRRHRIFATQIRGGTRQQKPFERAFARLGRGLPPGSYLVPTREAPLDRHGNIPGATIRRWLRGVSRGEVLVGQLGNRGPHGVWELRRSGTSGRGRPVLVMIAKSQVRYSPRFRFRPTVTTAQATLRREVIRGFQRLVATALAAR